jgi:DNA mismatch repair protein MutL
VALNTLTTERSGPRRIQALPVEVFTKIAAGEVVERPASVVKELIENSIDAGASRIDIDIEQGGLELIRIVDDGSGILPEDLPLAFTSHATSKLRDADDLFRVETMGFRGEALASIGSVAKVTLQSRASGAKSGAELHCEGGRCGPVRPWNGSPGTRIEVRNLFYNTPVRRRFLRTTTTEMGHVAEVVTRVALACPNLHLRLCHNERPVFEVPRTAELAERIGLFFGKETRTSLLEVEASAGPVRLHGFIADPALDRGNARMQYLFVNRRWIRDRALGHALQEAYHGLLMVGRYAVAFLFLEVPPELVDVNVHPTKSEVRFRDAQALYHLVRSTVRERLRRADLTPSWKPQASSALPIEPRPAPAFVWPEPTHQPQQAPAPPVPEQPADQPAPPTLPSLSHAGPPPDRPQRAIQLHDAYLVLETSEGMLVIDQHALHERIIYEAWKHRVRTGEVERQKLLVPEPIDLPPEQAAAALEERDVLERLGLGVEDFGGNTVLLTSYPAMLRRGSPVELFRHAVEHLAANQRPPTSEQLMDELLRMLACKAAIKAGDHLGPEEVAALVAQRHLADDTHHCPHGRPTALLFSKQELDRQFKRI